MDNNEGAGSERLSEEQLKQHVFQLQQTNYLSVELYETVVRITKNAAWSTLWQSRFNSAREDAVSVAAQLVCKALKKYDPQKGASVVYFAAMVARWKLAYCARKKLFASVVQEVPLTDKVANRLTDYRTADIDVSDREVLEVAYVQLGKRDQEVFNLLLAGMSTSEIAKELTVSRRAATMRVIRMRQRLRYLMR